ncbi:hypothetical protein [Bacillus sp. FJAT-47783]|uniref:hypothetical protein n=1 Tax=Bacillus sp. FJAT-47783 TaxID=2922712 RepID=UPI001FAC1C04|nr:hypothetical protein [Bacillus sp. FJAT-47783]
MNFQMKLYELFIYPSDCGNIKFTIYFDNNEYEVFAELDDYMSVGRHEEKVEAVRIAVNELIIAQESINP